MSGLHDQAEIRGQSATVGRAGGLVVLVRSRDVVGQLSGPPLDLALVVGLGVVLVFFGHCLHLVDGVRDADECAPRHAGERVALRADFTVYLEPPAETTAIVSTRIRVNIYSGGVVRSLTPGGRRS